MANQPRGKNWVVTLNNPTQEDYDAFTSFIDSTAYKATYFLLAEDKAPTTGTGHWHGIICFEKRHLMTSIKKHMKKWHIEPMRGTFNQAREYTLKYAKNIPNAFIREIGKPPQDTRISSKQNEDKWDALFQAAKKGKFEDIPPKEYIRYHKAIREIYIENQKALDMPPNTNLKEHFLWLWGSTGKGKSYTVRHHIKERIQRLYEEPIDIYLKTLNKWWDHYSGEKIVLLEEANPDACEHLATFFKTWFDEYAFVAEAKGAIAPKIRPEFMIVTSNYSIEECFPRSQDSDPLKRRLLSINIDHITPTGLRCTLDWPSNSFLESNRNLQIESLIRPVIALDEITDVSCDSPHQTECDQTEITQTQYQTNYEPNKQNDSDRPLPINPCVNIRNGFGSSGSVGNTMLQTLSRHVINDDDPLQPQEFCLTDFTSQEQTNDTEIHYRTPSEVFDENTIINENF